MDKERLADTLKNALKDKEDLREVDLKLEIPKDVTKGDYATPAALVLAKRWGKNPLEIAEELAAEWRKDEQLSKWVGKIEVASPGFVNFFLSEKALVENLRQILAEGNKFGKGNLGKGQTVVIDYSSINIAKPMHVGHLRSTIIGQALVNLYRALGFTVIADNHIGDWGTQFGKMIYAYRVWGEEKALAADPVGEMNRLYVKFHEEVQVVPELEEKARLETKKLQEGDAPNLALWKMMVEASLTAAGKIYTQLGVQFDENLGESFYHDRLNPLVEDALARAVAKESEGAIIVDLAEENLPPFLIRKSDGAFLYGTTDLATIQFREEKWQPIKILYVVSNEQALHFEQVFAAALKLGLGQKIELLHLKFGMVLGESGKKFSTRRGDAVGLESVMDEAVARARAVVEAKNPALSEAEKERVARVVGLGALKYNDLSQNRLTDITFDWNKMLNFEGNSAPYLQYTLVRIFSLREKLRGGFSPNEEIHFSLLKEPQEAALLRHLAKYGDALQKAMHENGPHLVALYLVELATLFNAFYGACPVVQAENEELKTVRWKLCEATGVVMKNGLGILGIETVEKM